VGKSEKERPLRRSRRRCVDNVEMDPREIGWLGMNWIDLARGRDRWKDVINIVMDFRVPQYAGSS
jgi:hypothetical protein